MGKKKDARNARVLELLGIIDDDTAKKKVRKAAKAELEQIESEHPGATAEVTPIRVDAGDSLLTAPGPSDARNFTERSKPNKSAETPEVETARQAVKDAGDAKRERDADEGDGEGGKPAVEYVNDPDTEATLAEIRERVQKKRELRSHGIDVDGLSADDIELQWANLHNERAKTIAPAESAEEAPKARDLVEENVATFVDGDEETPGTEFYRDANGADLERLSKKLKRIKELDDSKPRRKRASALHKVVQRVLKVRAGLVQPEEHERLEPSTARSAGDVSATLVHLPADEPAAEPEPADTDDDLETFEVQRDPVTGDEFDADQGLPVTKHESPRPRVWNPESEKLETYTRATTYIDCLDDKSSIADWRVRSALAGAAEELHGPGSEERELSETVIGRTIAVTATFQEAVAMAAQRDADGELEHGTLALVVEEAEKAMKKDMRAIASRAEHLGGTKVKAGIGTRLHNLTEFVDRDDMAGLKRQQPSPAEWRDLSAYVALCLKAGLEVKPGMIERRVVIDSLGVTGTFDRLYSYKLEGATRAATYMGDLKTGSLEYILAKTAMQLELYRRGLLYDPLTHERTKYSANAQTGLLVHLPAGEGKASLILLDLAMGKRGLKLAGEVREWRRETTKARALHPETGFARIVATATDEENGRALGA